VQRPIVCESNTDVDASLNFDPDASTNKYIHSYKNT
jgi:hypothetical protein